MSRTIALLVIAVGLVVSCHHRVPALYSVPPDADFVPIHVRVSIGPLHDEPLDAAAVTPRFFDALQRFGMGRPIVSSDAPGSVVVLSDALWRQRLGADLQVIGSRVTVDGRSATVVGIGAPGFNPAGSGWLWISGRRP